MKLLTSRLVSVVCSVSVALTLIAFTGCEPAVDPKLLELKKQFVVAEEPASPLTIEAAIQEIANQPEVTLVGRINAGSSEPFDAGQATMVLSEVPDPGHNHDPGDCPFCKRRAENAKSCIVRFLDQDGNVIKHGAQQLLGVSKDQDVVVKGRGVFLPEVDVLQVDATAVYVRPAEIKM